MLSATTFLAYLTLGFAALSSAVNGNPAAPSLTSRDIDLTNPQGIVLRPVDTVYTRDVLPRSNGERMKRGLAPLPPKRRHDRKLSSHSLSVSEPLACFLLCLHPYCL